jgi:hypothetical protein
MGLKTGPKPREDVRRYPSTGRIVNEDRGETQTQILATVLKQPHRKGERSQLAGFAFGRLYMGGMIDSRQYQAAEVFTKRAVRYMGQITGSLPRFPSIAANMTATFSTGSGADLDDESVASIRSAYSEIQDALAEAGLHYEGNAILMRVCIMDKDIDGPTAMGAFRCALNVIANRLRIA